MTQAWQHMSMRQLLLNVYSLHAGKCAFDQGSYTLTCTWDKLRTKQTVRFEVRGTKAGVTENIAVLTFEGGRGTSTADIFIEVGGL